MTEVVVAVQLDLPIEPDSQKKSTFYKAWARSGMKLPYAPGEREHAIAVWLRNLADSMRDQQGMKHSG
jgi:hypothetical protein